ncbi:MAG: LysR family transcriptional regulator [Pseudomonadota bacterium]
MQSIDKLDTLDERVNIARRLLRHQDPTALLDHAQGLDGCNINLLYGYVRSFVRLAYLGDVQKVADGLGITRQSVRNHILELENLLEVQLFDKIGAMSRLTSMGALWLPRAQEFHELAGAFLRRRGSNSAHYHSTQLPLRMLMNDETNSAQLREFARAWMQGVNRVDISEFKHFEPYCIVYERREGAWVSRSIGQNSAFASWFGADVAKNSEGKKLIDMETGSDLQDEVSFLLDGVYTRGGLHFSEVACNLLRPGWMERRPALYQRLLAEMIDECGQPVIASMIELIDPLQTDLELG